MDILALIALELDHLSHLTVVNDGACWWDAYGRGQQGLGGRVNGWLASWGLTIAGKLLLDDLEDLLLVEFLGQALDGC